MELIAAGGTGATSKGNQEEGGAADLPVLFNPRGPRVLCPPGNWRDRVLSCCACHCGRCRICPSSTACPSIRGCAGCASRAEGRRRCLLLLLLLLPPVALRGVYVGLDPRDKVGSKLRKRAARTEGAGVDAGERKEAESGSAPPSTHSLPLNALGR